ncbi:MAG: sulfotransferase [Microcoleaceae cyanobacterium]
MNTPQHILIYSLGRSGSNILLDSMDLDASTHCRNEPHAYRSSYLQSHILFGSNQLTSDDSSIEECMAQHWDNAVNWMSCRWGIRDRHHPEAPAKTYYRPQWWERGLPQFLIHKNKSRKLASILYPEFRREEYRLPAWILTPNWQENTTHVFKLARCLERQLNWILENRPQTKVVFLIRHPLGFAQSLYRRLYNHRDQGRHHRQNCQLLRSRLQYRMNLGLDVPEVDVDSIDLFESVLWNWFVFNQTSYELHTAYPNVQTVVYEQLLVDPVAQFKAVYAHCGLRWDSCVEQSIQQTYGHSAHLAQSFQNYWSAEYKQAAEQILARSSLRAFWTGKLWSTLDQLTTEQKATEVAYSPY